MPETPINHNQQQNGVFCACGTKLLRPISIREGVCQPCRNKRDGAGKAK